MQTAELKGIRKKVEWAVLRVIKKPAQGLEVAGTELLPLVDYEGSVGPHTLAKRKESICEGWARRCKALQLLPRRYIERLGI